MNISGIYTENPTSLDLDDSVWESFGKSKVNYRVINSSSNGIYFTFPSRDWTLDMSINIDDRPTYRVFGIRSGTNIKDCEIPTREEKDGLYIVSMSIHIGNGIIIKDSFKLRSLSGLDFWFMKKA